MTEPQTVACKPDAPEVSGSLDRLVRQVMESGEGRPQTYREWSHMSTCGLVPPDDRPEEIKVRELILEGKLPNGRAEMPRPKGK